MIEILKEYLDSLFAIIPASDMVTEVKSKLYDRMKQQYEICIQQGYDQKAAFDSVVKIIGGIPRVISQRENDEAEVLGSNEESGRYSDDISTNKVRGFIRNVSDVTSGLITGMFNGNNPDGISLVNKVSLPLDGIENVKIAYLAESITLNHSPDGNLLVREYMNQADPEWFAEVRRLNDSIQVRHGRRKGISLRSRIEVDIPADWNGTLTISNVGGNIDAQCDLTLSSFSAKSVGGNIILNSVVANTIKLFSSLGSLIMAHCTGKMDLNTSSGNIRVEKISGAGSFGTFAGSIKLYFEELSGAAKLSSETGAIYLHLPQDFSFELDAASVTGAIYSSFDALTVCPEQNRVHGFVGKAPYKDIEISTTTGRIHISE